MRPAQAAAGCVALMSAATTAARPARNRRMSASSPAKAGDAGKTTAALGGSPGYRMGYFTGERVGNSLTDERIRPILSVQLKRAVTIARRIRAPTASWK